jgi:hypothetical protein
LRRAEQLAGGARGDFTLLAHHFRTADRAMGRIANGGCSGSPAASRGRCPASRLTTSGYTSPARRTDHGGRPRARPARAIWSGVVQGGVGTTDPGTVTAQGAPRERRDRAGAADGTSMPPAGGLPCAGTCAPATAARETKPIASLLLAPDRACKTTPFDVVTAAVPALCRRCRSK